jgi:ABC-2 type transport system ATP-binding protein
LKSIVIKSERLAKNYGSRLGIADVGLEVRAGEVFGYLGPNGAGKTTTIRILLDLIRADSGKAEIFGLDVRTRGLAVRRRCGFLPGELNLYENMSCAGLLRFFAGLRGGSDWSRVEELAFRLGCHLSQPVASLSLGNKRKLGLIQAFMHDPDLLILDEPTSGLDPLVRHEFFQLVGEARRKGQTVFFSSHNLPEVARTCDRVAIIRGGRLAAVEDVAILKSRSLRSVEIRFGEEIDARDFAAVDGLEIHAAEGRSLKGRMRGEMDELLKTAARFRVIDFSSQDAGLEDVFLTYYGEDGHVR